MTLMPNCVYEYAGGTWASVFRPFDWTAEQAALWLARRNPDSTFGFTTEAGGRPVLVVLGGVREPERQRYIWP